VNYQVGLQIYATRSCGLSTLDPTLIWVCYPRGSLGYPAQPSFNLCGSGGNRLSQVDLYSGDPMDRLSQVDLYSGDPMDRITAVMAGRVSYR